MRLLKQFFNGFKRGSIDFGYNLAQIINLILLSIVYFVGVGITSMIAKLFRKRFLDTKVSAKRKTYWEELNLKKKPMEKYYRQF